MRLVVACVSRVFLVSVAAMLMYPSTVQRRHQRRRLSTTGFCSSLQTLVRFSLPVKHLSASIRYSIAPHTLRCALSNATWRPHDRFYIVVLC